MRDAPQTGTRRNGRKTLNISVFSHIVASSISLGHRLRDSAGPADSGFPGASWSLVPGNLFWCQHDGIVKTSFAAIWPDGAIRHVPTASLISENRILARSFGPPPQRSTAAGEGGPTSRFQEAVPAGLVALIIENRQRGRDGKRTGLGEDSSPWALLVLIGPPNLLEILDGPRRRQCIEHRLTSGGGALTSGWENVRRLGIQDKGSHQS